MIKPSFFWALALADETVEELARQDIEALRKELERRERK